MQPAYNQILQTSRCVLASMLTKIFHNTALTILLSCGVAQLFIVRVQYFRELKYVILSCCFYIHSLILRLHPTRIMMNNKRFQCFKTKPKCGRNKSGLLNSKKHSARNRKKTFLNRLQKEILVSKRMKSSKLKLKNIENGTDFFATLCISSLKYPSFLTLPAVKLIF